MSNDSRLPNLVKTLPPPWPASIDATLLVHIFPINGTTSRINIDLADLEEALALPEVSDDPENQDDGHRQHDIEPAFDIVIAATDRADSNIELSGENQNAQCQTDPCAVDAENSMVRNLIHGMAVIFRKRMCAWDLLVIFIIGSCRKTYEADRAPSEKSGKGRHSKQPAEDIRSVRCHLDIGDTTESEGEDDGDEGTTRAVNVGEDLGSVALLGKSGDCARTADINNNSEATQ
jgi:hypothetical protein